MRCEMAILVILAVCSAGNPSVLWRTYKQMFGRPMVWVVMDLSAAASNFRWVETGHFCISSLPTHQAVAIGLTRVEQSRLAPSLIHRVSEVSWQLLFPCLLTFITAVSVILPHTLHCQRRSSKFRNHLQIVQVMEWYLLGWSAKCVILWGLGQLKFTFNSCTVLGFETLS